MSGLFIILSTFGVKDGKLGGKKKDPMGLSSLIEAREPQLIAFNAFPNTEGTEMTSAQVHPDAASMDFHLKVIREHLGDAMSAVAEFVVPKSIKYYGTPPESLKASIAGRGGDLTAMPIHIGGFTRSSTNGKD